MGKKLNPNPKSRGAAAAAPRTVFETVSLSSDSLFQRAVSILHTSYLDSASEHGFQYSQVTLVKNDIFLNEYKTFYQEKKASNYTHEELQETYGFLLFETENQAKLVCQRGLCVGSSAITTLGDPAKGVYISKYSDYLHARPWYHGKSGYIVIFNLIKGRVKFVPENYTTNYTSPSSGCDCHVAADTDKVSPKTSHFRTFELSQYYLYELSGSTVTERPRQICPYVIVAFQYREPKKMAAPAPHHNSVLELKENVLISPWKGKLIIQGCLLCDITLWSSYGTVVPTQLPHELDFKYVMKVSSLKKRLPEAAFKKQNYSEQKVCCQEMCFNMYEVELSNKQGEKIDKLTEYIKNEQLAIIRCLEEREFFILLTSSALISETNSGEEQAGLHGLHLFHLSPSAGLKDLKVEDDISLKVTPVLPALNCALLEAKKSVTEKGISLNTLVKHNFRGLCKVKRSPALTAASQDGVKETAFFGKASNGFDLVPPAEKCPLQSFTQLKSYFSDPNAYILEVSTALDLLVERPQSPCISDGICDAAFSLVMTPDPEFHDSEAEVRKETETEKNSEEIIKARQGALVPLSSAVSLRVQPKRKGSAVRAVPSKRVSLCRPLPKRTPAGANKGPDSPTTLKLVKGQFPQKRKRGAEVLTAQFVQTTKLDRKNQDAPVSKDVPVAMDAKRARKQEKPPVKTVPWAKPPVKKSPQKQRVNIVRGTQNPRIRKQPQPAKGETASQLQSEISDGQEHVLTINTAQPENITVAQKAPPETSLVSCDSQALNMLADLALRAATSSTVSPEARLFHCSPELPQNDALLSKEHSLHGTSDHEYHRGVRSPKGGPLLKSSPDKESSPTPDPAVNQEEGSLVPGSQAPAEARSALPEETLESSDSSQSSFVAVEHSYALLLAEHSKRHLQQRGAPGPAFAKNGTKGPEAGTPVGKVMPFRHQQSTSPLQKLSEDPALRHRGRLLPSSLKDFCSHTVFSCDGSFKVTFKCETDYVFSLDSKYTNNPLEKTVVRALHGPWNTDLPDNVEEVKLLLHMWVALFYSNQNKVIRSSRKVVEHSNPAKYVSINSTLDSFEFSEVEEPSCVDRCPADPLSEARGAPGGCAAEASFPDTHSLLPFVRPPPTRGLELWLQSEQKEVFVTEGHLETPESQNYIYSSNGEISAGKAKQETSEKVETSDLVLSGIGGSQTNGPSIPGEEKAFEPLDSTRVTSYNDAVTQTMFAKTCDGASSPPVICQQSVYGTLQGEVDVFHAAVQAEASALQGLAQHASFVNKEHQPSAGRGDDTGCVMINLEPVTLTFEKSAYVPVQTEVVSRPEKATALNVELMKQVSPASSLPHPASAFEKAHTQSVRALPSLAAPGQKGAKHLCAPSVNGETLAKEMCSLPKEQTVPGSPSPPDNSVALSLFKSSNCSLPREEMKLSQEFLLQTQSLLSISSEEIIEPSQVEDIASSSAPAPSGRKHPLGRVPSVRSAADGSSEPKGDRSGLTSDNRGSGSYNSALTQQTSLPTKREEVSLELSEEDSDLDLTLAVSPPMSHTEVPTGGTGGGRVAPLPGFKLQEPEEEVTGPGDGGSAGNTSAGPLEEEERGDNLPTVTLLLSKETCALGVAEEVHAASDFPFAPFIEEVSPASSPDPQAPGEAAQPARAVSPGGLKLSDTQCRKSDKFSQMKSVDLATTGKENFFVGPTHPVGQGDITQAQQVQLSAETPPTFRNRPGREDRYLTLPGQVTEKAVPAECGEGFSFSEKVPFCDAELSQPASAAKYGDSPETLATSGTPLQPVSTDSRDADLCHLVLGTGEPPASPRKMTDSKSFPDTFLSAPSGVSVSLRQQAGLKSGKEQLVLSDLKSDAGSYLPAKSLSSSPAATASVALARVRAEVPRPTLSSDSAAVAYCPGPLNVETGFQTEEISVIRMASLLKNNDTEGQLHGRASHLGSAGAQLSTAAPPEGRQRPACALQDRATCETQGLPSGGLLPLYLRTNSYRTTAVTGENSSEEPSASFVPKSRAPLVCGVSEEQTENETAGEGLGAKGESEALGGGVDIGVSCAIHYEPLSGDSDQDFLGDCGNPKSDTEDSCASRRSHSKKKEGASKGDSDTFRSLNSSGGDGWGCSGQAPGLQACVPPRSWPLGLKKEDVRVPCYVQIRDLCGVPRSYANFTVTKEHKEASRTLPSLRGQPSIWATWGPLSLWTDAGQAADSLTQNTLDLEYLRFAYKLNQIVKGGGSWLSAPATTVFPKEPPLPAAAGAFPLTTAPDPLGHPASRSRSPLVVTVVRKDTRHQSQQARGHTPGHGSRPSWNERCGYSRNRLRNSDRSQTVSFHLNKLRYNSTLKESRSDISLILSEYAEFNKVMANSHQAALPDKGPAGAPGEAAPCEPGPSPARPASYEDMVSDLCTSLRVKLERVVKEACTSTFLFHLVETEDRAFFVRTKNILRKGGHVEADPQRFCQAPRREEDTLMVIIRNEDIASHLHQIPSLLKLKHLPSVVFAGVDSPEDVLDGTHQELLRTGGFVVSDDTILETLTLVQLKEIVKILEKLNGNGRWKWLLHYRETKKLREDVRVDPTAHRKSLILKSCQSADITEPLPYHQCDSRSSAKTEHLKCLLSLQVQHVHARFAVFLTEKPVVSREIFENGGILVTDVNDFVENIQKVAAPFRSSYW
ncbi:protein TASOR 2 isoform X1 [Camelus bactrianus]|uniref:Protein TASOR 2 isoform X1 n=2 Tax=Camelus bactrianus TaxID=9837 RepID=A0AC58PW95_CAMBA